ncbi:MAG: NfeD family protein [Verrucomicrobiia bacterium]
MTLIITLLVVGSVLMFLETLLPGMITGIIGFLCLAAAVFLGYREFGLRTGNFVLGGVVIGLALGVFGWLRFFPESRFARRFISTSATGDLGVAKPALLHCTGVAITQLRPSGAAIFGGKRVDVVTEGGLIDRGAPVKVMKVEGARVVVREVVS